MKITLVDPNLVRTFLVIAFLILIMVRTLENNYFLVRTKLGYLRYFYHSDYNHLTMDSAFHRLIFYINHTNFTQ